MLAGREQDVDAVPLELRSVRFERARVTIEVLVGAELEAVDEDARDDAIAMAPRDLHE